MGLGVFENLHDAASAHVFAENLKAATQENFGAPIREYLANLVMAYRDDPAAIVADFKSFRDDFIRDHLPPGASGQVISVCGRFGVAAMAGEFATALGLTGWPAGEATNAAAICFRAWLDQRGTLGDHDIEAGIRQVIAFVEQSRRVPVRGVTRPAGEWEDTVSNRAGFRHFDQSVRMWSYFVLPNAFKSEQRGLQCARCRHRDGAAGADYPRQGQEELAGAARGSSWPDPGLHAQTGDY